MNPVRLADDKASFISYYKNVLFACDSLLDIYCINRHVQKPIADILRSTSS
jgi:hypothetical protein